MAHLMAQDSAAIFSPSVARIAASTARDWSYIDSWLASKFQGRTIPPFERNPDTLKALLTLAGVNEAADEERQLVAKAEAAALKELTDSAAASRPEPGQDHNGSEERPQTAFQMKNNLLDIVEQDLSKEGHTALDSMANMSLQLGIAYPEPEELGQRMVSLQTSIFEAEQMKDRVDILQRHIEDETFRIQEYLLRLQKDDYKPSPDLAKNNLEMQRKVKALTSKLPELQDRVAALSASINSSHPTVDSIAKEEQEYLAILTQKKELDHQMAAFHGLPSNTDMARSELEALRGQLRTITSRRDAVFEGLVERESPVKRRGK